MTSYVAAPEGLRPVSSEDGRDDAVWIDLIAPSQDVLARVSERIGVELPSREEQDEIEHSSRLYLENGVPVMTVLLPAHAEAGEMSLGPVSFVLLTDRLVTVRHHAPKPFSTFPQKIGKVSHGVGSAEAVLIGLLEEIIDRLADITEQSGREIDMTSRRIFGTEKLRTEEYRQVLRETGRAEGQLMQLSECLMTVERMLGFLMPILDERKVGRNLRAMLKSQYRDIKTITEQTAYLHQKTAFMLDAALGLINIEQNAIIKIFSVVAVAFLPPTLVASVYGMNFKHMPELSSGFGYPLALGVMVLSAVLPLWFFHRRGWL